MLIANRGEIAVRLIRACRELGIETAAVYSDADADAPHVALADVAHRLGPPPARDSYLNVDALLNIARQVDADAVHPGYGFLAESAPFATACTEAGLTFIGPPPDVMARFASKTAARRLAVEADVPVIRGATPSDQSDDTIAAAAQRLGYPIMLKPNNGGGGIGMKVVREPAALRRAIAQARRESAAAFGDSTLFLERFIDRPRHVEVQIIGDHHGNVVHLFERECSIQRRHQKVIEESPSVALTAGLRTRLGAAAVAVARTAGYRNAGTVEFLLDGTGDDAAFYFLEVNARLQVEHPVTEAVVGVDLVHAQIAVAAGQPLAWRQDQLSQRGHAIEVRVYAEDPAAGHLPAAGPLLLYREPRAPGVRVDSGVAEGSVVGVHYDPLLAKLIAYGESRAVARARAAEALRQFPILGCRTNIGYLLAILEHPRFVDGAIDVRFLDEETVALTANLELPEDVLEVARAVGDTQRSGHQSAADDPWTTFRGFRG